MMNTLCTNGELHAMCGGVFIFQLPCAAHTQQGCLPQVVLTQESEVQYCC